MAKKKMGRSMKCVKRAMSFRNIFRERPSEAETQGDKVDPLPQDDDQDRGSHHESPPSPPSPPESEHHISLSNLSNPNGTPSTISTPTYLELSISEPESNDPQTPTDTTPWPWSIEDDELALDAYFEKFETNPFLRAPDPNQSQYRDWLRGLHGPLPRGCRNSIKKRKCIPSEHPEYQDKVVGSDPIGLFEPIEHVGVALSTKSFVRFEKMNPYKYFGLIPDKPRMVGDEGCCALGFCPQCVLGKDVSV
ncbi:uncharacterized protein N7484_003990 [Penicillium longicatenatum]|uniref:uncharacterized protein n=1 Tax=Penicillium longicatenatum TaxID=1561947 RepID=UPI002546C8C9|nr:uncharacterized protein N7484_003990 [Penicillium longicatenatum]KAJ5650267.1 hypothetical protein N7484_003990 [Penicillium longicatenatum]